MGKIKIAVTFLSVCVVACFVAAVTVVTVLPFYLNKDVNFAMSLFYGVSGTLITVLSFMVACYFLYAAVEAYAKIRSFDAILSDIQDKQRKVSRLADEYAIFCVESQDVMNSMVTVARRIFVDILIANGQKTEDGGAVVSKNAGRAYKKFERAFARFILKTCDSVHHVDKIKFAIRTLHEYGDRTDCARMKELCTIYESDQELQRLVAHTINELSEKSSEDADFT